MMGRVRGKRPRVKEEIWDRDKREKGRDSRRRSGA